MVALDMKDGEVAWKSQDRPAGYSTPALFQFNGKWTLAAMNVWGLSVVDAATGKEWAGMEWGTPWETDSTTPIVKDDVIFISTGYAKGCALLRLSESGLSVVYRKEKPGDPMSNNTNNSILHEGLLYGFDGEIDKPARAELVCMDFATGAEKWRAKDLGCGSLMVSDGKLIILSDKGELVTAEATGEGYRPISRAKVVEGKTWTMPTLANGRLYIRTTQGKLVCLDLRSAS
jgi:outer membrane protein assembly factor BamB